jgi:hypothetical protein
MIRNVLSLLRRRAAGSDTLGMQGPLYRDYMSSRKPADAPRLLLVAMFDPAGIPTIYEQIEQICALSGFRYDLFNCWNVPSPPSGLELPATVDLSPYDGLFIHCTTSYNIVNLRRLDANLATRFADFPGVKIMMKQDEHYRTHQIAEYLGSRKFDILLTCVRPQDTFLFYPVEKAGKLEFVRMLTGYVTDEMRRLRPRPFAKRPIDVGYRGSLQPWNFGRLAWEKCEIGERFRDIAAREGLRADISSKWEDRFTGKAWFDFLQTCRAVLGVESGASIVDFDGEVENETKAYLSSHPGADFAELSCKVLEKYESNAYYKALSPRHFEAAACKCVQILYEGEYVGILQPERHYVPLRRDFANVGEVIRQLKDLRYCQEMVDRAHKELISSDAYTYRSFVATVDQAVRRVFARKGAAATVAA